MPEIITKLITLIRALHDIIQDKILEFDDLINFLIDYYGPEILWILLSAYIQYFIRYIMLFFWKWGMTFLVFLNYSFYYNWFIYLLILSLIYRIQVKSISKSLGIAIIIFFVIYLIWDIWYSFTTGTRF